MRHVKYFRANSTISLADTLFPIGSELYIQIPEGRERCIVYNGYGTPIGSIDNEDYQKAIKNLTEI